MERTAAIVGAGLVGRAWAMVFARAGWQVRLYDAAAGQLDLALTHIASSLAEQQAAGLVDDAAGAAERVSVAGRLADAVSGADWVQENLPEEVDVKSAVFRELDGFILNRLQGALLSEAMRLVGEGYVSPQDLDKTIAHGLGLRWSFMGPFATIELNAPGGVADYCARYAGFYRRLDADPPSPEVWTGDAAALVVAALGESPTAAERDRRMDERDRRLLALARHKREQSGS